ncbi:ribokinase [Actinomycetota bacterium]|nr:ribokinase [Actinomycetota bacterium]
MTAGRVAVVGSANLDIVVQSPHRPTAGETVLGTALTETPGGKGANQALASARVGPTAFVGQVGSDAAGDLLRTALAGAGVDVTHVRAAGVPSGRAYVTVTPDGENSIVVLPLANATLDADRTVEALDAIGPAVVLTQLEIPPGAVEAAADWCVRHGARFVLNPSPVGPVAERVLAAADPLIVNRGEALAILGTSGADTADTADTADLATRLLGRARSVVVTAGPDGAVVATDGACTHIPGARVTVVDTTGAGDSFAGTLAAHLAAGRALDDAARLANAEAARVIQLDRAGR